MYLLYFFLFIIIVIIISQVIRKIYFKSDEDTEEEDAINFMQNYKVSDEEKIAMQISSAISSNNIARKNLRRLIAAEIKARVVESALEPTAFPSCDEGVYEKSKRELENEKEQIESALVKLENEENERKRLFQEIRNFLQTENISEEWLLKNPQLFYSDLQFRAYQQTPSFAKKSYKKLNDFGLLEAKCCIQNKNKIINEYNVYKKFSAGKIFYPPIS
jgi:hypothetical protein